MLRAKQEEKRKKEEEKRMKEEEKRLKEEKEVSWWSADLTRLGLCQILVIGYSTENSFVSFGNKK